MKAVHRGCLRNSSHVPAQWSLDTSQISFWIHLIGGFCSEGFVCLSLCVCDSETDSVETVSNSI